MTTWTVAPGGDHLLRDGDDAFLLADTLWAAFTAPTLDELRDYARLRARQGFTGVLINMLPIPHDRGADDRGAFPVRPDGAPDLDRLAPGYLEHAVEVLDVLAAEGLQPVLVLLWNNYAPGTWGARLTPELVMTEEQSDRYVEQVVTATRRFHPLFLLSGDDNFDSPAALERYRRAGRIVRRLAPEALTGLHTGTMVRIDDELASGPLLDLYTHQSGHDDRGRWPELPAEIAAHHLALSARRPILNLEPPYEGHGVGPGQGRHRAADVRRASWASVLSGAAAGIGYGAHGVWSWHRRGESFAGEWFSGTPFPASVALGFRGADDLAFLRRIVERHRLWRLRPRPELLGATEFGALAAADDDASTVAVWSPHPFALSLALPAAGYRGTLYDLEHRRCEPLKLGPGDTIAIAQPEFLGDLVVVLERE